MRSLPDLAGKLPDVASGRKLLARVLRRNDAPEPVAAWRAAPEAALRALDDTEKQAYVEALLPLMRSGHKVNRRSLRRLYQLFTFMEMPAGRRADLVEALHTRLHLAPERLPNFNDRELRRSLLNEAVAMGGRSPTAETREYLERLRTHLNVSADETSKWSQFFEKLTDLENRVAATLGKKGHIVRAEERRLEIFKKAVASIGVPAAVLFPLGTVGLSAEGIATGLVALGGGFLLPASVAMVTGLGVAVALGVSAKKVLDMVMPSTDADRFSIDIEKLSSGTAAISKILDEATAPSADHRRIEEAGTEISRILDQIVPLSDREKARLQALFEHARILGERYLDYLAIDRDTLESRNHVGAGELAALLDLDGQVIRVQAPDQR